MINSNKSQSDSVSEITKKNSITSLSNNDNYIIDSNLNHVDSQSNNNEEFKLILSKSIQKNYINSKINNDSLSILIEDNDNNNESLKIENKEEFKDESKLIDHTNYLDDKNINNLDLNNNYSDTDKVTRRLSLFKIPNRFSIFSKRNNIESDENQIENENFNLKKKLFFRKKLQQQQQQTQQQNNILIQHQFNSNEYNNDINDKMITNRSNLIDESNNKLNRIMSSNSNSNSLLVSSENEIDLKKRNKLDEYYHLEEKQARLLKLLANIVLIKLNEENKKQTICEQDEINKVFFVVVELEKLASLVHEPVANLVKKRVELEWNEKSYFGDILISNYQFYKVYKAVLARYPTSQVTLSNLLKKKNFANCLKKILDAEADSLENVNRLDMLLDRLVDFPRRILQLLESYLKLLDTNSDEYLNIKKVKDLFTDIFELSNDALEKMNNFQSCYELHYMFDPPLPSSLNIIDQNRHLIKQGSLNKVAKRSGELLIRHLALFSDMLLVGKPDRIKRKLIYNYHIESKDLKLIENSNPSNELMFRLIGSDQNNEFKTDKLKDKEDWIKAFKKLKDIQIIERSNEEFSIDQEKIGIIPPIWIKDNEKTTCSNCNDAFTTFKRRHHCRTCGKLYCNTCCNQFIPVQFTQFKDKVRTCRDCYDFLEKSFQKYKLSNEIDSKQINTNDTITNISKTLNGLYEIINDKFNSTFSTDNESDNLNESYRLAYNKQSRKAVKRISLKKNNQINQSSISNSTNDDEEDSDTEDSDSLENEDIEIIKEDINLINFTDHVKPLPAIPKIENKNELKPKVLNLNSNSKLSIRHSLKREVIKSDYGYLSKLAIEKNIEIDSDKTDKNKIKWDRTYFVLYSDYTIGVCASHNDLNNPSIVIQLGLFNLKQINETTLSLIKEELINMDKCLESDSIEKKTVGKLNKKLSLFECNYELKFKNKEIKNEWFELIKNQYNFKN